MRAADEVTHPMRKRCAWLSTVAGAVLSHSYMVRSVLILAAHRMVSLFVDERLNLNVTILGWKAAGEAHWRLLGRRLRSHVFAFDLFNQNCHTVDTS